MANQNNIKLSKYLCLVLRHKPETVGIGLDGKGWTDVAQLIVNLNKAGKRIDFAKLKEVVDTDNKNRFSFNETFEKIRANQGHSVEIDLGYIAQQPPELLYHGTSEKFVNSILQNGIKKQNRHHVHLSIDVESAIQVGKRHGEPYVFEVLAKQMFENNFDFFLSENKVWLTDSVPFKYLKASEI